MIHWIELAALAVCLAGVGWAIRLGGQIFRAASAAVEEFDILDALAFGPRRG